VEMEKAILKGDFGGMFPRIYWVLAYTVILLITAVYLFLHKMKKQ
jgi:ABC-2 type transport system permease protein